MNKSIKTFRDLQVYQIAHALAMRIFELSKSFPAEERYSLTDQVRRSSRSVAVNIAEGWGKRVYENSFKRHLIDSTGSLEESKSWILFALNCQYINQEQYDSLIAEYEILGAKLYRLYETWKSFE
jgi:four helix bundle protein